MRLESVEPEIRSQATKLLETIREMSDEAERLIKVEHELIEKMKEEIKAAERRIKELRNFANLFPRAEPIPESDELYRGHA